MGDGGVDARFNFLCENVLFFYKLSQAINCLEEQR
jgi:hypothetical protein